MSTFTRAQAREVAAVNDEAALLISQGRWTPEEFIRLRGRIRELAPEFGDAQSYLVRHALPEWTQGLETIPKVIDRA